VSGNRHSRAGGRETKRCPPFGRLMLSSSRWSKTTTITRSLGPSGWALGSLINLPTIHVSQLLAVCHFLRNPSPARHTMTATRRAPSLPELRQTAWCHCAKPTVMLCGRENSIVHQPTQRVKVRLPCSANHGAFLPFLCKPN
jgi:hypothetical protein